MLACAGRPRLPPATRYVKHRRRGLALVITAVPAHCLLMDAVLAPNDQSGREYRVVNDGLAQPFVIDFLAGASGSGDLHTGRAGRGGGWAFAVLAIFLARPVALGGFVAGSLVSWVVERISTEGRQRSGIECGGRGRVVGGAPGPGSRGGRPAIRGSARWLHADLSRATALPRS